MPRISEFRGIVIQMFYDDHPPPHYHVSYGGTKAKVLIADGSFVGSLPRRSARLVRKWHRSRREALEDNWRRARAGETMQRIRPLP